MDETKARRLRPPRGADLTITFPLGVPFTVSCIPVLHHGQIASTWRKRFDRKPIPFENVSFIGGGTSLILSGPLAFTDFFANRGICFLIVTQRVQCFAWLSAENVPLVGERGQIDDVPPAWHLIEQSARQIIVVPASHYEQHATTWLDTRPERALPPLPQLVTLEFRVGFRSEEHT